MIDWLIEIRSATDSHCFQAGGHIVAFGTNQERGAEVDLSAQTGDESQGFFRTFGEIDVKEDRSRHPFMQTPFNVGQVGNSPNPISGTLQFGR